MNRGRCFVRGALRLAVPTAAVVCAASAAAADDGPVSRQAIADDMGAYYSGERTTAYIVLAFASATAATGAFLATRRTDFARGMGWSMVGLGALQVVGAAGYVFAVNGEIAQGGATLARDASEFKHVETAHIQGTTSRFLYYRLTELTLLLGGAGVAAYGFASRRDLWKGIGLGVALEMSVITVVDTFNNARAIDYLDHLQRFQPTLQVGGGDRPWGIGVTGHF